LTANWVAVFGLALFFNANTVEPFPVVTTVSGICPQNRKTDFRRCETDRLQALSWEQGEWQWQFRKEDRAASQKFYLWKCDAGFARWSVILGYSKWLKRHRYAGT